MEGDDWDKLSRRDDEGTTAIVEEDRSEADLLLEVVDRTAPALLQAWAELEEAKKKVKHLTEDVVRFAPEVPGEVVINGNLYAIQIKRAERLEWDSEVLAAIYAGRDDLPEHIKMKLSVDKKRYDRMSELDREDLRSALTIKLSAPTVEVVNRV